MIITNKELEPLAAHPSTNFKRQAWLAYVQIGELVPIVHLDEWDCVLIALGELELVPSDSGVLIRITEKIKAQGRLL